LTAKIAKDAKKKIPTFTEFRFQQRSCRDFHNGRSSALHLPALLALVRNADLIDGMSPVKSAIAQYMRHPPVDDVHSIDFPADTSAPFLLTLKMKGVKTNSFFDSF
jgi:hypothetical protein